MERYDTKGNKIYYQNLRKEKIVEYIANYYGYDNFIEYEHYIVNQKTGEVVAKIEYENGLYNLLARNAKTYNEAS